MKPRGARRRRRKSHAQTAPRGARLTHAAAPTAAELSRSGIPLLERDAPGAGGDQEAGQGKGGACEEAASDLPPARRGARQRHGSASSLPLYGAAWAHSFCARPARHLRSLSNVRHRQHVGPRRRDPVRHPDLPVRGTRGAADDWDAGAPPAPIRVFPAPGQAHHLLPAAGPRTRPLAPCDTAGPQTPPAAFPRAPRPVSSASPGRRRSHAGRLRDDSARRPFEAGVGVQPPAPRPAPPHRCPSTLEPQPRSHGAA